MWPARPSWAWVECRTEHEFVKKSGIDELGNNAEETDFQRFFRQINEGKKLGKVISRQSIPIWNFEEIIRQNTVDYVVARNRFNFTNFIIVLKVKIRSFGFFKKKIWQWDYFSVSESLSSLLRKKHQSQDLRIWLIIQCAASCFIRPEAWVWDKK